MGDLLAANLVGCGLLLAGVLIAARGMSTRRSTDANSESYLACDCGCADLNEVDEADELETEWISRVNLDHLPEANHG